MKKIEIKVSTNVVGSERKKIIEVDDDSTENQIEEIANETMWEMIDFSWRIIE
jgi:hypothetical protein